MSEQAIKDAKVETAYAIKGMIDLLNKKIKEAENLGLEVQISPPSKMGRSIKDDSDNLVTVQIYQLISY